MLSGVAAVMLWAAVILFPTGEYTGQNLITEDKAECQQAVEYARSVVPDGFVVTDCIPLLSAEGVDADVVQAP